MRAVLTSIGTTGDVQPLLALAVELRKNGITPRIAHSPHMRSRVEALRLDFTPIGPDWGDTLSVLNAKSMSEPELYHSCSEVRALLMPLVEGMPRLYEDLLQACGDAGLLISGPAHAAARMVHERTGIPFVSLQFSNFGGAGTPAYQSVSREMVNPFRESLGLAPLPDPLTKDANSPSLVLYGFSRHLFARPDTWPEHHHVTGFFFLDDVDWKPPVELAAFCASGSRPITVTFGSMVHREPESLLSLLEKTSHLLRRPMVVQLAGDRIGQGRLSGNLYAIDYADHHWLFPRSGCVVHHGGSGTTASVLLAGVPTVFVPHIYAFDQPYWALFAERIGRCGPAIPFQDLTAEGLARAIGDAISDERMLAAASALAEKVRNERGAQKAIALIERLLAAPPYRTAGIPGQEYDAAARRAHLIRRRAAQRINRRPV